MNLYYARFEVEYIGAAFVETTATAEEIVYAKNKAHAEKLLGNHFNFANDYDDDIPNIDTLHLLESNVPKREKGGLAAYWLTSWWIHFLAAPRQEDLQKEYEAQLAEDIADYQAEQMLSVSEAKLHMITDQSNE